MRHRLDVEQVELESPQVALVEVVLSPRLPAGRQNAARNPFSGEIWPHRPGHLAQGRVVLHSHLGEYGPAAWGLAPALRTDGRQSPCWKGNLISSCSRGFTGLAANADRAPAALVIMAAFVLGGAVRLAEYRRGRRHRGGLDGAQRLFDDGRRLPGDRLARRLPDRLYAAPGHRHGNERHGAVPGRQHGGHRGGLGRRSAVLAGFFLMTNIASQFMPNPGGHGAHGADRHHHGGGSRSSPPMP